MPEAFEALCGWVDHPTRPEVTAMFPDLAQAAPHLQATQSDAYLYRAWKDVLGQYPDYPAQEIGDCTSFGSGHVLDLLQCVQITIGKRAETYKEVCTEAIYGMGREIAGMLGSWFDGCYGSAVTKACLEGVVPRELVGTYSGDRAKEWGSRGVPPEIKAAAAQHKLGAAALLRSLDQLDAGLQNGYLAIACSNWGFKTPRDADGVCRPRGRWAHCMGFIALRWRNGRRQYLIAQSWGPDQPEGPLSDDQPSFTFWIDEYPAAGIIAAGDSFLFSALNGFPGRPIPSHWRYDGMA
jgi:hypothetical protein